MVTRLFQSVLLLLALALLGGCGPERPEATANLVLAGGSVAEEVFAKKQLATFHQAHPEIKVAYQATPSSASERHTLYVT